MQDPLGPPIDVRHLLAPERAALVDLLSDLDPAEWRAPTPCSAWNVHQLALHLVHDDLRRLSGQRDGHPGLQLPHDTLDELAIALDEANEDWVDAVAPTVSPQLTCELLRWLAAGSETLLANLDPMHSEQTVAWAGTGPHQNWLDVAREYTERWIHQQQIRDAVGRPGLDDQPYVEPVIDTFVRALPAALPDRPANVEAVVEATGPFERSWTLRRATSGWLFAPPSHAPDALVSMSAATWWRRAVRMISHQQARENAHVDGDPEVVTAVLDIRSAIVQDR